ncbi:tRNA (adenosine(37)-N6)-threonylcarbamoyltransferase complex dimerization subunit type 1 TsaB [Herbaspirillum sp. RTI4]|uniref:tRNA (adenosine(37)-N6)-threonylcarbamoyltransferase complex dimerization subunit type 1 TsaB n=1 Tax=Herbaspirillum sp. RTI4 TaxID=3048640 RepID=UPI002AB3BD3C|nr:tRNA (adenosine(37)-N6)-threonylcarbamoyltransferase complex dimerization subunit type 1 TsaB [Herbaspirillum sp. RTI4]MDY7578649.1 tRNA (adenosine(37)-N6)-threonylcarbamoyltransferase complex dimerization subunit type 1 TsaB [Herbaspirillum sp. RTI4]MEA9980653.1 tRNA (adenosine(37)-N6)-threonylcarbamoyltransferase complex dimerization subunit type 1 TsaB [Herbaspirillum sp. RTI4]
MPVILSIETSADLASAALLRDGHLASLQTAGVHTHSDTILPMVQTLLAQAGVKLADCAAIAFGVGPGSFTGVRTACGIVQGLAFGADLPVVPVVTLLAMAQACHERCGAEEVVAVMDARMGEVYWAQYRYQPQEQRWEAVIEPVLSSPALVVPVGVPVACGNGLAAYAGLFAGMASIAAAGHPDIMPHAEQIARLGAIEVAQGRSVALDLAQPFYLRNKVALTTAERMAKVAS